MLNQQYHELNDTLKIDYLATIIKAMIDSANLDESSEARDCLDVFDNYEWKAKEGCDLERFNSLLRKGNDGELSKDELDDFMGLVSDDGETHLYYVIRKAKSVLGQ